MLSLIAPGKGKAGIIHHPGSISHLWTVIVEPVLQPFLLLPADAAAQRIC